MVVEDQPDSPFHKFQAEFTRASAVPDVDATAVALATADAEGRPSARMVLLKGVDERGFVFFTNYESRKGAQLSVNPRAALCFHWAWIFYQVRAEGEVERVSDAESDAYFATRPRGHQVGAWASSQSRPLASREELLSRCRDADRRYAGKPVPRPPYWGGYRLKPERVEFWQGHEDRLHDRMLYLRTADGWTRERLFP